MNSTYSFFTSKLRPVISTDCATPSISSREGAMSAKMPSRTVKLLALSGIYRNRKVFCDDLFNLLAAGLWNLHLSLKVA